MANNLTFDKTTDQIGITRGSDEGYATVISLIDEIAPDLATAISNDPIAKAALAGVSGSTVTDNLDGTYTFNDGAGNTSTITTGIDVNVSNFTYNSTTKDITITQTDSSTHTINVSDLDNERNPAVLTSTDGSTVLTATAQADGQVDYNLTNPNPLIDPGGGTWRLSHEGSSISMGPSTQVDMYTGQSNTFRVGSNAGVGATGNYINAMGSSAANNSAGNSVNALGLEAAKDAAGAGINAMGYRCASEYVGSYNNSIGYEAGYQGEGLQVNNYGRGAGAGADGNNCNYIGYESGKNTKGNFNSGLGTFSAGSVSGDYVLGLGDRSAFQYNGDNITAVGHFTNASKSLGAVLNATVDSTNNTATVTGHGLGAAGTRVTLMLGGTTLPGGTTASWNVFEVVDANTLAFISVDPTSNGSGVTLTVDDNQNMDNWTALGYLATATSGDQVMLGNTSVTEVVSSGDAYFNGTFYASDERLKKNFKPIENAIECFEKLDVGTFEWNFDNELMFETKGYRETYEMKDSKDVRSDRKPKMGKRTIGAITRIPEREKNKTQIGLIAQQVQEVFPEAVKERKGILTVDYAKLSVLSIGALKELVVKVNELETKLSEK